MDRSPGFGSTAGNYSPYSDLVSLRLRDFYPLTSLHTVTRRLILQKARRHPTYAELRPLVGPRFQVLFHSPPGVLFTFPSRYYALSVAVSYLALESGLPCFRQDSSCPVVLKLHTHAEKSILSTGLSPSLAALPSGVPLYTSFITARGVLRLLQYALPTPVMQRRKAYTLPVWALPVSLAATQGISVDFSSSRYLDGSVPWVLLHRAMYSLYSDHDVHGRVTPFGHPGINRCLLFPRAFRSLPRPSSPDSSKASAVDPYSLDHIILQSFPISSLPPR
jgi:hypothetical protein